MKRSFGWSLVVVLVACLPAAGQTPAQTKATIAFLQSLQAPDGGFFSGPNTGAGQSESLRATSAAWRALRYFGGQPRDPDRCRRFVRSCFDPVSGGFADHPGANSQPDAIMTAVGIMAVVEMRLPAKDYAEPAMRFLEKNAREFEEVRMAAAAVEALGQPPQRAATWVQLARAQLASNPASGDLDARTAAGAVVTLLRLGAEVDDRARILKVFRTGQRADGGFAKPGAQTSDLETCYRVSRAFVMLRAKPTDVPGLRRWVGRCRNADGGYGIAPEAPSTVSATYFAASVLHWFGD
jgi:prenyltransferase beta subunit